jgi:hypothetical protein
MYARAIFEWMKNSYQNIGHHGSMTYFIINRALIGLRLSVAIEYTRQCNSFKPDRTPEETSGSSSKATPLKSN